MPLPDTRQGLEARGYEYTGESKCKRCGEYVEWYATPNKKSMPFCVHEVREKKGPFAPVEREIRVNHIPLCGKEHLGWEPD
jgi:hypothetical protein